METAEVERLFALTLLGDYETDAPWEAVSALQQDGDREIFERAAEWCVSDDPLKRARAADILCQLRKAPSTNAPEEEPGGEPEWLFRDESYALITEMLRTESDTAVLYSAVTALGHLDNAGAVPEIIRYQDHPDENIRFAVACALGCFPDDPQSVRGLLKLTSDADADVRDWAVFGLGVQGEADSPEIREALLRCLNDEHEDVREEAAVGLGKRQDLRLIPKLLAMLDEPQLKVRVAEAATALLGLEDEPPAWASTDYKAALAVKFQI